MASLNFASWGVSPVSSPERIYVDMNLRKLEMLSLTGLANLIYDLTVGALADPSTTVWSDATVRSFEGPPVATPADDGDWRTALCVAQRLRGCPHIEPDLNYFQTHREGWPYEAILYMLSDL